MEQANRHLQTVNEVRLQPDAINLVESQMDKPITINKKAIGLMAQLMKLYQQHLSCLRRCFCFSS